MTTAERAAARLGRSVARARPLSGGDLAEVTGVTLDDGRRVVAKTGPTARAEAGMLAALAGAGVPAPEVLAVEEDLLVMSDLGRDEGPAAAWGDLGGVVATLHGRHAADYGWTVDHAFGPVEIRNGTTRDWPAFWGGQRLMPSVPHLPADLGRRVERLADRLPDLLPARPAPSLLHGDLWTGNVMAREGRVTGLIDPACYYGHGEVDLAMLCLFGAPGPAFWAAYGPLEPGWEARRAIYTLWPALVHFRLFGAGYRGLVERCLDTVG